MENCRKLENVEQVKILEVNISCPNVHAGGKNFGCDPKAAMLLFLPCSGVLSKLAMLTVPNSAEEAQEMSMPVLDERLFKSPAVALQQAKSAVVKMSPVRPITIPLPG